MKLVKSLHDLVCGDDINNIETMPMEEVYSYLKKNNIDHKQVISNVQDRLKKMKAKASLDEAKAKRTDFLEQMNNFVPSATDLKESVKSLIDRMMTEKHQLASAYFRKFESATEDDLKSLYRDLKTLEYMDKDNVEK